MSRSHKAKARTLTSLVMSLVVTLFLACQGMAMAGTVNNSSAANDATSAKIGNMPGCHLMKGMSHDAASNPPGDNDCQHIVKAFDGGNTAGLVWAYTPAILPSLTTQTSTYILTSTLPSHDPVVDPPPTLRFHRFLE